MVGFGGDDCVGEGIGNSFQEEGGLEVSNEQPDELNCSKVYYQNVCILLNKGSEFGINLLSLIMIYNVFALTETWLRDDRFSGEYFNKDVFQIVRADHRDFVRITAVVAV